MKDPLAVIRNYYRISEDLATSGQPEHDHFFIIREEGFEVVVNLSTADSPHALSGEAGLLESLGLDYFHIPVDFSKPAIADLEHFIRVMQETDGKKRFIHCALNWRVSAFIYLYRVKTRTLKEEEARQDLNAIWQPDATWRQFIDRVVSKANR